MNKLTEALKKAKIYNSYDIVSKGSPMIFLHIPSTRECTPHAVVLSIRGMRFKNVGWYQDGDKWFSYLGKEERVEAYQKAFEWIKKNFPKMEMVKSPFSRFAYVPKEDLERALEKINKGN